MPVIPICSLKTKTSYVLGYITTIVLWLCHSLVRPVCYSAG